MKNKLNIDNEEWLIIDGVLKEYRGSSKEIIIPEGVIEIAREACSHKDLISVHFPKSLKVIGTFAFISIN